MRELFCEDQQLAVRDLEVLRGRRERRFFFRGAIPGLRRDGVDPDWNTALLLDLLNGD
jgi:hypothetical protein